MSTYGINVDVEMIESTADEMDMFSKVHKLFPRMFARQEEQFTFPVYDTMDSGSFCLNFIQNSSWISLSTEVALVFDMEIETSNFY